MTETTDRPATSGTGDFTADSFPARPEPECDIIMKGGITSGVIYPLAVCELAQTYRLHSVGGASAGAIAAAAAAAAEVGRASLAAAGDEAVTEASESRLPAGFLGLAQFPTLLTAEQDDGKSLLFHLFRPQPEARRLFELLTAGMDEAARLRNSPKQGSVATLAAKLLLKAASKAPRRVLIGMLPGLLVVAAGLVGLVATLGPYGVALSLLTMLLGVAAALLGLLITVLTAALADLKQLPAIGFGISSGRGENDTDLALTPWLHARLQELAGRATDAKPLTFEDLSEHDIDFQVMTTNLSRAQPLVMPWNDDVYFFEPAEFTKLFGKKIVDAMVAHPPPLPTAPADARDREVLLRHAGTKRPFPPAEHLPIIVATRMSLSFPLLISAVPLYTVDWGLKTNQDYAARVEEWRQQNREGSLEDHAKAVPPPQFDVNWFSDGGLTANLPVHFFDAALPSRPTFAIDLAGFSSDHPRQDNEAENSYLPTVNQGGLHRRTARWKPEPTSQLISFGLSLVETARIWVDEASLAMPGYRDRVVTVYSDGEEGGLNLSMDPAVVRRLSDRGRFAARKLVNRFGPAGPGWENHRWLRFRAATAALSDWFVGFEKGYTAPAPRSYDEFLQGTASQPSYEMTVRRRQAAKLRLDELRAQLGQWSARPADAFTDNRPQPQQVLRLVPRIDADLPDGGNGGDS